MPPPYQTALELIQRILLGLALLAGVVCLVDWAIRARHISPFSYVARFFRRWIDPRLRPIETMIARRGGLPQEAPFYAFMAVIVGGLGLLLIARFIVGLIIQVQIGVSSPSLFGLMLVGWALNFLVVALIVRVISSFLPISPYSGWVRWSYVSTEWFMAPIRRVIPPFGQIDFSPLVAYILLRVVAGLLGV
jgi:YggT family protein